jgi:hypothetical protein
VFCHCQLPPLGFQCLHKANDSSSPENGRQVVKRILAGESA